MFLYLRDSAQLTRLPLHWSAGQKYALLLKFSLIRMYEIQISLRRLSYFDLYGRLRLTMELMRCMVEVPLILDRAMREDVASTSPSTLR